jgi:hypothetical protein
MKKHDDFCRLRFKHTHRCTCFATLVRAQRREEMAREEAIARALKRTRIDRALRWVQLTAIAVAVCGAAALILRIWIDQQ